jgi:hypothetical protein
MKEFDSFLHSFDALVHFLVTLMTQFQFQQIDPAPCLEIFAARQISPLLLSTFDSGLTPPQIDSLLILIEKLASADPRFARFFAAPPLFNLLLGSDAGPRRARLLLALLPHCEELPPTQLFDWMDRSRDSIDPPVAGRLLLAIARHFPLGPDAWCRAFGFVVFTDSPSEQCDICALCELALAKNPPILPFLMERGFVWETLALLSSPVASVQRLCLRFAAALLRVDPDAKFAVVDAGCLPLVVAMIDSPSEGESAEGIGFLTLLLPEFAGAILASIDTDLLWAILFDGMREGSVCLAAASVALTAGLMRCSPDFAATVVHDNLCEIGCRLCQLRDDGVTAHLLEILGFLAAHAAADGGRFADDWCESGLAGELALCCAEPPALIAEMDHLIGAPSCGL